MDDMKLMQFYLDDIKRYFDYNPDLSKDRHFAYSKLEKFNIPAAKNPLKNVENLFENCENYFQNRNDIGTYFTPKRDCFLWFMKGKLRGSEIKLYIPMDEQHVLNGSKQLFDFIASTGMEHQSKIARMIRTDNVVIRVNNINDANKIINYVNSNSYIREGMLKTNPFLPSINGIGLAQDDNKSYNATVATLITEYYNRIKSTGQENRFTVSGFNKYVESKIEYEQDLELKEIYELIVKKTSAQFKIEDFYSHAYSKSIDRYTSDRKRIVNPSFYLEEAIKLTVSKHPQNLPEAIIQYLRGNSNYFTNDSKAREGLEKYVQPRDMISIMRSKLNEVGIQMPHTDVELATQYTNIVCREERNKDIQNNNNVIDNSNEFEIIKNAYLSTLKAHGQIQADTALKNLFVNNEVMLFTNQFGEYRKKLKTVLNSNVKQIILSNIDINGLDVNNLRDIVDRFYLEITKQENLEKTSAL